MKKRILTVLVLGVAVGGLLFHTLPVSADDSTPAQSISLSPATTQVSVDPGASVTKTFDVVNAGSQAFNVKLYADPYYVTGTNYDPHFDQLPGTVDASKWIQLAQPNGTIAAGKVLSSSYTLSVPVNTAPGGYYAVIFAETNQDQPASGGIVAHNRVGNILYITVNGPVKQSGALAVDKIHLFQFTPTVSLGLTVSNTGGVHFATNATFSVTDLTGNQVFKQSFDRLVIPQTVRAITTSWMPNTPIGIYKVHRTATVAGQLQTSPETTIIVVNPWFVSGIVLLLIVLIAFTAHLRGRRNQKKTKDKSNK